MGDVASGEERRFAFRVPVQGAAVCYGITGPLRGTIENLSSSGALIDLPSLPSQRGPAAIGGTPISESLELELKLGTTSSRIRAHTVRVEPGPCRTRVALRFDSIGDRDLAAIEAAIDHAVIAAERRPVLVVDDNLRRRDTLVAMLETQGMAPVAARTPLDAIAVLTNPHLVVSVALLAPSFGHSLDALHHLVSDSYPWVRTAEIVDDLDETIDRAQHAWAGTASARLARAIA